MFLLNFSYPLTPDQLAQLEALTGAAVTEVRAISTQLELAAPLAPQIAALADAAGLTPAEWQTVPLLVVPPSLNFAALALLAELHGRCGYFPTAVRLRPVSDALPPRFEVAELLNLHAIAQRRACAAERSPVAPRRTLTTEAE